MLLPECRKPLNSIVVYLIIYFSQERGKGGRPLRGRRKVLKIDRPMAGGLLGLTAPMAPRVVDSRSAAMIIKSALREYLLCHQGYMAKCKSLLPLEGRSPAEGF